MKDSWLKKTAIFIGGQTITLFGSSLVQFGITWYITLTTTDGVMITLSTLFGFLPQAIISLFAGVWADRYNRKTLIILADGAIAACTAILAILWANGFTNIWLLFFISAVRSVGSGIQTPAVSAFLPDLVPQEKLLRVNGIHSTIQNATFLLAPVVAGGLYASMGIGSLFWVDVITAAVGIGLMLTLKVARQEKPALPAGEGRTQMWSEMKEGLRYIGKTPWLKQMTWMYLLIMVMAGPVIFLTPLMVARTFGTDPNLLVQHEIAFSLGSIVGGLLISTWGGLKNKVVTMIWGCAIFGATTFAMGFSTSFWFYLGTMALMGVTMPFVNTEAITVIQTRVEPELIGRVFGMISIISSTAMPLSMVFFGPISNVVSVETLLIITGALTAVISLFTLRSKAFVAAGEPV